MDDNEAMLLILVLLNVETILHFNRDIPINEAIEIANNGLQTIANCGAPFTPDQIHAVELMVHKQIRQLG